ncbi:MAG: hypothetical protein WDZ74_01295, partial [Candidatus Paceibacterota bacterium]
IYYAGKNDCDTGIIVAPFKVGKSTWSSELDESQSSRVQTKVEPTVNVESRITISAPLLEVGTLRTVVVQGPIAQMLHINRKLEALTQMKHSELRGDTFAFIGSWVRVEPFTWSKGYVYGDFLGATIIVDITKLFDERTYLESDMTGTRMRFELWDSKHYSEMLISRALTFVLRRDLALEKGVQLRDSYATLEVYKGKVVGRDAKILPPELQEGNGGRTPLPLF